MDALSYRQMQQSLSQQQINSITNTMIQTYNDIRISEDTVNQRVNLFNPPAGSSNDLRHPPKANPIPKAKGRPKTEEVRQRRLISGMMEIENHNIKHGTGEFGREIEDEPPNARRRRD